MGSIPLALSIHHFVSSVGSDAGFAAIIGLAILILLYFAQARETASLRNHAQEAADRIQQLEARLAEVFNSQAAAPAAEAGAAQAATPGQTAQGAPAVSRAPAALGALVASQPASSVAARAVPSAPAGVAAPALTAATRLIPAPDPGSLAVSDHRPAGGAPVGDRVPATAAVASPAPATVAGGANGSGRAASVPPPGRQAPPPRVQPSPAGTIPPPSRRPAPGPAGRPPEGRQKSKGRRVLAGLAIALGVGAVVAAVLILTSGGSGTKADTAAQASNATHRRSAPAAFNTSQVTVAVLNGTSTSNLAHDVAQRLVGAGYKHGTIATATDQTHQSTSVAFLPGFKRDAVAVAGTLKLKPAAVQAIDPSTQAVACPPPSKCQANVVVTVGSDLAGAQ